MSFPFIQNDLSGYLKSNPEWDKWWDKNDCENTLEKIEEAKNIEEKLRFIKMCAEDFNEISTPVGKILSFNLDGKIYILEDDIMSEAYEWISDQVIYGRIENYITLQDFNKEFWDDVSNNFHVYHGTNEDRVDDIMREGLSPKDETRGIANRSTGSAVFTSSEPDTPSNYYDIVLQIDVGQMKKDGYMPDVSMEEPIQEKIAIEALANMIGLDNYEAELEDGYDYGTVIFYGNIPSKYISVLE